MFISSDEPKVVVNVKTAISASSPHFFDRFNKDRNSIINKNVFNESGLPLTNRYMPNDNNRPPAYIAHFSIITLKDFYNKRFNHISGSRLAKPNFSNINFKKAVKKNYILIYLLTILKIKKEDFINMTILSHTATISIIEPFYTMIDLYLKRNKNDSTNTTFNKFINDNPELYANQKTRIINITKDTIIKMINKITINTSASTDPNIIILKPEAIKIIFNTINNSTINEILEHGLYTPNYSL